MKEIFKPLFILLAAISMTSCTDMLDIKPTTFVSDDLIWQDKKLIDQFSQYVRYTGMRLQP